MSATSPPSGRPPTAPHAVTWIPALLSSGAVLGLWLWGGGYFAPPAELPPASEEEQVMVQRMPEAPDAVIVGNSQAYAALDAATLDKRLGLDGGVATLTVAGSKPYLLYKLLDGLVFREGKRPRLVLLTLGWDHLLSSDPPRVDQQLTWARPLSLEAPAADARVLGRKAGSQGLDRVVTAWRARRALLLDGLARAPLSLLGDPDPEARLGVARTAVLGDAVLGDMARDVRMIPVVEAVSAPTTAASTGAFDDSLLQDFVDLADAHGARLVVVSPPQRRADLVAPASRARELVAWLEARGAAWIELQDVPVAVSEWKDDGHVSRPVATRISDALADRLLARGALEEGPMRTGGADLRQVTVARVGALPTLPALTAQPGSAACELHIRLPADLADLGDDRLLARDLGASAPFTATYDGQALEPGVVRGKADACDGTFHVGSGVVRLRTPDPQPDPAKVALAWSEEVTLSVRRLPGDADRTAQLTWVAPGTAVRWTLEEGAAMPEGTRLDVSAVAVTQARGVPTLTTPAGTTPMTAIGALWHASAELGPQPGAMHVEVRSPADGPWLAVRAVVLRHDDRIVTWAGSTVESADQLLLAGASTVRVTPSATSEIVLAEGVPVVDGKLTFEIPEQARMVTPDVLYGRSGFRSISGCTPLGLQGPQGTDFVRAGPWRASTPWVQAPDDAPQGATWKVVLDAKRHCGTNTWLYPGESVELSPQAPAALATGARWLHLEWLALAEGRPVDVHVTLRHRDEVLLDEVVTVGPTDDRTTRALDTPVPPVPSSLTLTLSVPEDSWLLVRHGALSWDPPEDPVADAAPDAPLPSADAVDLMAQGPEALVSAPKESTSLEAEGSAGVRWTVQADQLTRLCAPRQPVGPGTAHVHATLQLVAHAEPPFVAAELGWFAKGQRLRDAEGKLAVDRARWSVDATAPRPLVASAPVPEGADEVLVCLARGKGEAATLLLSSWTLDAH